MTEGHGLHLPHGKVPTWAWWIGGALVVLFLLRRGQNAVADMVVPGGGQSQALRSDVNPRQAAAEELQLGQLKKQFAYQDALAALDLNVRQAQSTVVTDYARFYDQLSNGQPYGGGKGGIKCPSGKPRIDPTTGRVYCREKQGGGFHWDDALKLGTDIWKAVQGVPSGGTSAPRTKGPAPSNNGGWSVASGDGGGGIVTPANVIWCDGIDC